MMSVAYCDLNYWIDDGSVTAYEMQCWSHHSIPFTSVYTYAVLTDLSYFFLAELRCEIRALYHRTL